MLSTTTLLLVLGAGVLLAGIFAWIAFQANAKGVKEMREEIKASQATVEMLAQSVNDIGQHISGLQENQRQLGIQLVRLGDGMAQVESALTTSVSNLQENQRQLGMQIIKLGEGVTQVERSLTSKIIEGDRHSDEAVQNLRQDTFQAFARLQEDVLRVFQSLQQNSSEEIHALQKSLLADLGQLKEQVSVLHTQSKERKELERQTAESIRRLEAVLAGTQSKGVAGERIVEQVFAKLPAEWRIRNFRINGKVVEFGLRLPNGLVLPVDSKWPSSSLIEKFAQTDNVEEQIILKREIEKAVLRKAQEARKYIDPSQTLPFAVIVVPDAVFDLSMGVHAESVQLGVAILSYSMFVPYLLLVFHTIMKASQSFDLQSLATYLANVNQSLNHLQEEIEGRFSRALTMLNNSRDSLRAHLQRANASMVALEVSTEKDLAE